MTEAEELADLKARIATVFAQREQLKQAMGDRQYATPPRLPRTGKRGCGTLRAGFAFQTIVGCAANMKTFLDWSAYQDAGMGDAYADIPKTGGDFAKAVAVCINSRQCEADGKQVMCPSYRVTWQYPLFHGRAGAFAQNRAEQRTGRCRTG